MSWCMLPCWFMLLYRTKFAKSMDFRIVCGGIPISGKLMKIIDFLMFSYGFRGGLTATYSHIYTRGKEIIYIYIRGKEIGSNRSTSRVSMRAPPNLASVK